MEDAACEVQVERIAAGGDGVGRELSGRVVFIPRTAPGDRVAVEILESRARWARGRVVEWLDVGPNRRQAPCPLYARCGGCRLQHLSPEAQRESKRELVRETLRRIGKVAIQVPQPLAAGEELGYRNRTTFTLRGENGRIVAGYHDFETPGRIMPVDDCLLAEESVRRAWSHLRGCWDEAIGPLPDGEETRVTVRGSALGAVDILFEGARPVSAERLAPLLLTVPGLVGCHEVVNGEARWVCGEATLPDRWQSLDFDLPPGVFLQVNREISNRMDEWLDSKVGAIRGQRVLDLYSGVGARAVRWALAGGTVTACEVSRPACQAGRRAAARAGAAVEYVASRVESCLADLLPADLVVVNPPRAGLSAAVTQLLAAGGADRLAYVSCDPATLARDLERLSAGWRVADVQPFDAFPQTAHVETIALLERDAG